MRSARPLTRVLAGVAGTALLLSLAACGDDSPSAEDTPSTESASSAPVETAESESEEPEPVEEVAGGYDEDELLDAMKAAVAENESAHLTMEMGGAQGMSGEGDVSYAGDETSMQMTMQIPQMGTGEMQMRMVDGVMYLAMPPMTPEGKFIKIETDDPNSPLGDLGGIAAGDPLATFDAFEAGLQDVKYLGEEDVDGEPADHYVLTVDAHKAAKAQGQQMQPGMPDTVTYDMWIDDQDLMRRIQFDLGAVEGAGAAGGMVMTMSDWGKPVTVKAPPAGAIMEMPSGPPNG